MLIQLLTSLIIEYFTYTYMTVYFNKQSPLETPVNSGGLFFKIDSNLMFRVLQSQIYEIRTLQTI
jgi:hypothetical protein